MAGTLCDEVPAAKALFEKTGVTEANDLKLLDQATLRELADLFKDIPKVKFLNALAI